MNRHLRFLYLLLIFFGLAQLPAKAQTAFASEDELKARALKLFEEDEFEEAYPLYSQLASLYPKDPNYNYRLGVCMLYASDDKEKPIPFLEFASKKPEVEKEVFFYLAKAYHLNYRFDDAIRQYQEYEKVASASKSEKLQVERQMEMCRNGKKLLRNLTDLVVIEKKEMSRTDFYRSYDISGIGGKLLLKPDEQVFKSAIDKKKKEKSIIYLASNNSQVYFSSYGDDPERGKDIYIIRKLPSGEWSKAQTLGYPVNTEYDEDFPFLHPNGKVLYFCSKGHNSMGGYDIFKTTLNEETNTWNKPVNMDFPVNTPDDDILYVTNEDEKEAFFSSARNSVTGKTAVFHINVERKPVDVAIIKGFVMKNRDGQALDVKITVKDLNDNVILGIFNSKAQTGGYLINLPNGGKFMYTVEAAGFATQSEMVVVPVQYEFKPLKQEISYELGTDKLIIKNLFDEPVDDASYMLALNFIKERSRLEVNANEQSSASAAATENTTKTEEGSSAKENTAAKSNPSLSNEEIIKIAYQDAKDVEKEAKDLQEQADLALSLANQKNELAQNKSKEAAQLMADAGKMEDVVKKEETVAEANVAFRDADELNQETVAAFNIAKKLQAKAVAKDEEADLSLEYAKGLEAAVKSKNPEEAMAKLDEQEKKLEEMSRRNGNAEPDNIVSSLKLDEANKKKELDKATQLATDIRQEIADNESLIVTLQADADKTKKADLKQGLLEQIAGLKEENTEKQQELEQAELKAARVQKEYNGVRNEMALVNNVVDQSKTATSEEAAAGIASIDKSKLEQQVNEIKNTAPVIASVNNGNGNTSNSNAGNNAGNNNAGNNSSSTNANNAATNNTIATNNSDTNTNNSGTNSNNTNTNNSGTGQDSNTQTAGNTANNTSIENVTVAYNQKFSDELAALESLSNELERENKRAELYQSWVTAISDEMTEKKAALKTEKDKARKKSLNEEIVALEKEKKDKEKLNAQSIAGAEKIRTEQAVAGNSGSNSNIADQGSENSGNTSGGNSGGNSSSNSSVGNESPAKMNERFGAEVASAEQLSNEAEKELAKADALRKWSEAADALANKKKVDLAATDDPEMKAMLQKQMNDAEQISKEKKALADQSTAKAESIRQNQSGNIAANNQGNEGNSSSTENSANKISTENSGGNDNNAVSNNTGNETNANTSGDSSAANNSGGNDPNVSVAGTTAQLVSVNSEKLNEAITAAAQQGTALETENKKAEAYTSYLAIISAELEKKKRDLEQEKNKAKRKDLNNQIALLEKEQQEKTGLLEQAVAKADSIKTADIAAVNSNNSNNSTNNNSSNSLESTAGNTSNAGNNATENSAGTNAAEPGNTTGTNSSNKSDQPFVYTSSAASGNAITAAGLEKDAENLLSQSEELKNEAADEKDTEKKNAIYAQAEELTKQAERKKIEAAAVLAKANEAEYKQYDNELEQLAAASANKDADELVMAEMMKDEAKIFFAKAQDSRKIAAGSGSWYAKETALEDALKNEMTALSKQQKAAELYRKYNPGFVASVSNNVATNNAADPALNATNNAANNTTGNTVANTSGTSGNSTNKTADNAASQNNNSGSGNAGNNAASNNGNSIANNTTENTSESGSNTGNANTNNAAGNNNASDNSTDNTAAAGNANNTGNNENGGTTSTENSAGNITNAGTGNDPVKSAATNGNDPLLNENSNSVNTAADNAAGNNNMAAENSSGNAANNTAVNTNAVGNSTAVVLAPNESFEKKAAPVYSAAKPIPVNEKLPEGLIFKVQIGAFRKPIPQDMFQGITPITGETTPQGFTRYTAGVFLKFETADNVKKEIRDLGFRDAFVVAFLNGKRIPIMEALQMAGISVDAITDQNTGNTAANTAASNAQSAGNSTVNPPQVDPSNGNTAAANTGTGNSNATQNVQQAPAKNVAETSGLFYTVQVGVYSKPVSSAKLFGIQPLNSEVMPAGTIRYTTGRYSSIAKANEAKNKAVQLGVKDAFVTAYRNGQRIAVPEAAQLESQGASVLSAAADDVLPSAGNNSTAPVITNTPAPSSVQAAVSPVQNDPPVVYNPVVSTPANANNSTDQSTMPVDSGVVFKVQIGAFRDEVPLDIANKFLKIAGRGIRNYSDENGLTIYTVGTFRSYDEAAAVKAQVAGEGLSDAFVVAYKNGKKISVEEAKLLMGN